MSARVREFSASFGQSRTPGWMRWSPAWCLCPACFEKAGAGGPSADGNGKQNSADSGGASPGGKQSRTRLTSAEETNPQPH